MAGALARYGSALYGWAIRRGTLSGNPFERVPIVPTVRRERVVSDDEINRIWAGTEGPGAYNGIVRMLMLTGQRREEVARMTWDEIAQTSQSGHSNKSGKERYRARGPAVTAGADSPARCAKD